MPFTLKIGHNNIILPQNKPFVNREIKGMVSLLNFATS